MMFIFFLIMLMVWGCLFINFSLIFLFMFLLFLNKLIYEVFFLLSGVFFIGLILFMVMCLFIKVFMFVLLLLSVWEMVGDKGVFFLILKILFFDVLCWSLLLFKFGVVSLIWCFVYLMLWVLVLIFMVGRLFCWVDFFFLFMSSS